MKFVEAFHFFEHKFRLSGKVRKYTGKPYFTHCARVTFRTLWLPYATEDDAIAAAGHDYLEDLFEPKELDAGIKTLKDVGISEIAIQNMLALYNPSKHRPALPRAERKRMDVAHYVNASRIIKAMKLIDRADNLSEMFGASPDFIRTYLDESTLLLEVLKDADNMLASEFQLAWKKLDNKYWRTYDQKFGDNRLCDCGHPYYRHFDTYDEMACGGCKYCDCGRFREAKK